jgi:hypothetical protein
MQSVRSMRSVHISHPIENVWITRQVPDSQRDRETG